MIKRALMVATVPSMIGQFNMNNIQILQELGYEVDVAADFTDRSVWTDERIDSFKEDLKTRGVQFFQIDFSRKALNLGKHIASYKQTLHLLRERDYSLIHTHTPIASAIVRLAARKVDAKVIYTAHGFHFYDGAPLKNWIIYYPVEKILSRLTDIIITINKEDYRRAESKFNADKVIYIPGVGVDTVRFSFSNIDIEEKRNELGVGKNDFLLLSVGEISERKNQKVVIDALIKLKEIGKIDNIVYLIVGEGDKKEAYEEFIKEKGLESHIIFLGYRDDIVELCHTVDCFIHPSIREGLGIAPLEAMAAGLPLISSWINGMKDYTENGISGCCINPKSKKQFLKAIEKMHDDINYRQVCGNNNKENAKNYDIRKTNIIMKDLYKELDMLLFKN